MKLLNFILSTFIIWDIAYFIFGDRDTFFWQQFYHIGDKLLWVLFVGWKLGDMLFGWYKKSPPEKRKAARAILCRIFVYSFYRLVMQFYEALHMPVGLTGSIMTLGLCVSVAVVYKKYYLNTRQ